MNTEDKMDAAFCLIIDQCVKHPERVQDCFYALIRTLDSQHNMILYSAMLGVVEAFEDMAKEGETDGNE